MHGEGDQQVLDEAAAVLVSLATFAAAKLSPVDLASITNPASCPVVGPIVACIGKDMLMAAVQAHVVPFDLDVQAQQSRSGQAVGRVRW